MRLDDVVFKYTGDGFYEVPASELFRTEEEAKTRADEYAKELTDVEHKRLMAKEKDKRSWAWNVHYHRKAIKDAEKQIAYHTSKLNFAKTYAKPEATQ